MPTNNYPNGTNSNSGYSITGAATVHAAINDAPGSSGSDTDYIAGYEAQCSVALATPTDPGTSTGWKLILRNKHDGTGLNSSLMTVRLKAGGSTVKTWNPTIGTSFTYREVSLSAGEADAVRASLSDLDIEVDVEPVGVDGANGYLSALALQAPDPATVSKAGSDTLGISLTESAAIVADLSRTDTLGVSLTESASLLVKIAVSDTLDVSAEEGEPSPIAAYLDVHDQLDLLIPEVGEPLARIELSDTLDVATDEALEVLLRSEVADDLDLAVEEGEPSAILAGWSVSDDLDLSVDEALEILLRSDVSDDLNVALEMESGLVARGGVPNVCLHDEALADVSLSEQLLNAVALATPPRAAALVESEQRGGATLTETTFGEVALDTAPLPCD